MPKLKVMNLAGKEVRDLDLPDEVFAGPVKEHLIQEAVIAFRAAGRSGTHATKNRSDVSGGGKKPWKQKKTGRARHGSIRSPIWKGGGTVFGPQPRDYSFAFPRKKRHGALRSALSAKHQDGKIVVVESLVLKEPKTRELVRIMGEIGVKGSALLVDEPGNTHLEMSARNLAKVKATLSTALNIIDLMLYDTIVLTEAAAGRVAEVLKP